MTSGARRPERGGADGAEEPIGEPRLRVVDTDERAWERVYREHVVPVYRYCYVRTGNRADAEDVTAQVFLRALPRLRLRASPGEIRGYLVTTARTVLADFWQAAHSAPTLPLEDDAGPPGAGTAEAAEDGLAGGDAGHRRRALEVLARLPERSRQVLELRFLRGLSLRETAGEMGVSVANVKVLQWRALRRAARLDEEAAG